MATKEITEYYFKRQRDTDDLYVCRCGKRRKQNPRRGYGNLMDHIRSDHPKYLEELRESNRSPFPLGNISEKAHNIYGWLHWVITDGYPFSFVDKKDTTQQYSRLKSTCAKTLVSYMSKVTTAVESKITNSLPSQFGIMVDGWSEMSTSTHYIGVYAVYAKDGKRISVMLAFAPLIDETTMTADSHIDLILFALSV